MKNQLCKFKGCRKSAVWVSEYLLCDGCFQVWLASPSGQAACMFIKEYEITYTGYVGGNFFTVHNFLNIT